MGAHRTTAVAWYRQAPLEHASSDPQHLSARPAAPPGLGGSFLSDVALTTAVDHGCLVTISSVVELTWAADDRPWQFRQVGLQFQVHIGPPRALEYPLPVSSPRT
jgi:hypothetical protein